jgi:hypothetical protein
VSCFQTLFCESPWWLGGFCFLLFAVILFWRRRWTGDAARYSIPMTLAAIAVLFLLQWLVTTQREAIRETMERFVAAVERKDAAGIRSVLSSAYDSEDMNREDITAAIDGYLSHLTIRDTRLRRMDVTAVGDRARMELGALATVSIRGAIGEFHTGLWQIDWVREGNDWRITALRPVMIDTFEIRSIKALGGHIPPAQEKDDF